MGLSEGLNWPLYPTHWERRSLRGPKIWPWNLVPVLTSYVSSLLFLSPVVFICKMGLLLMAWRWYQEAIKKD